MAAAGDAEIWKTRLPREMAARVRDDALVLGLPATNQTEILRAALELLRQSADGLRANRTFDSFYGLRTAAAVPTNAPPRRPAKPPRSEPDSRAGDRPAGPS